MTKPGFTVINISSLYIWRLPQNDHLIQYARRDARNRYLVENKLFPSIQRPLSIPGADYGGNPACTTPYLCRNRDVPPYFTETILCVGTQTPPLSVLKITGSSAFAPFTSFTMLARSQTFAAPILKSFQQ